MSSTPVPLQPFNLTKRQIIAYAYYNTSTYTATMYLDELGQKGKSVICYAPGSSCGRPASAPFQKGTHWDRICSIPQQQEKSGEARTINSPSVNSDFDFIDLTMGKIQKDSLAILPEDPLDIDGAAVCCQYTSDVGIRLLPHRGIDSCAICFKPYYVEHTDSVIRWRKCMRLGSFLCQKCATYSDCRCVLLK